MSDVTSQSIKYLLLLMTPITAVFVFFSREILQLWLGSQFADQSAVVMQIGAILIFVNAFAYIPYSSVQALGRPELKAILDLVALPFYVLFCLWFMNHLGINGATLAKLLITVLDCGFLYLFARRMKAFSIRSCFKGPLLRAMLASGGLFLAVYIIHSLHSKLIVSIFLVALSFLGYAIAFWLAAIDRPDRTTILELLRNSFSTLKGRRSNPAVVKISE